MKHIFLTISLLILTVAVTSGQSRRRNSLPEPASGPIPVVTAPQTRLLESMLMGSSLLNAQVRYSVYLPPDYYTSNRRYPVVYLLHGLGDDETSWIQFGEVDRMMDEQIRTGHLPPMIIVMPDATKTWYMNDYQNKYRYEDMFVQELIPHIDKTYRTRASREFRAVSGLSMGGHGSLLLAMHHPDLFSASAAMSAAVRSDETLKAMDDEGYNRRYSVLLGPDLKGEDRVTVHWKRNSPLTLSKSAPEGDLKQVQWYLDCGDDDALSQGNAELHLALLQRKIPHEYRARDGAHTWSYWRTGLPLALAFIAKGFER